MRTLIIEDEGAARRRLEGMIKLHPTLELVGVAASGYEAIALINASDAELLLMDIQLKDMTAFEVLNTIGKDYSGKIIFITAYNNFAVRAFEVYAVDYLLKPYTQERLFSAINRCLNTKNKQEEEVYAILESLHFPEKIGIPEGRKTYLFEKGQIVWIEADGYHCRLYLTNGENCLIRILLKDINQLLPNNFLRISRSIIINKNHVVVVKKNNKETYFQLNNGKDFFGKTDYFK